ncbi:unnamed protein product, partial [Closterium sp. NIES-54]
VAQASDNEIAFEGKRKIPVKKTWAVNPELYPCQLSDATSVLLTSAVEAAVASWGANSLPALEAEDRLAFACEKGPTSDPVIAALRAAFQAMDDEYRVFTEAEKQKVIAAGGLHVVGTERHESRRIDNQLRGRSGRQGDPGSSRFFLSLEDNIFRIFGGDRIQGLMKAFRVEDMPIESKMLTKALDEAQRKVENYFFDIRKQLFEYDQVGCGVRKVENYFFDIRKQLFEYDQVRVHYEEMGCGCGGVCGETAYRVAEGGGRWNYLFDIRKQLFEYDQVWMESGALRFLTRTPPFTLSPPPPPPQPQVLNSQRDRVYAERRRALVAESLEGAMIEYAELTMDDILEVRVAVLAWPCVGRGLGSSVSAVESPALLPGGGEPGGSDDRVCGAHHG